MTSYWNRLLCILCFVPCFSCSLLVLAAVQRTSNRFDVLIRNGRIVDGTGAPGFRADIGITADRVSAIGHLEDFQAATTIDLTDLVVAPGSIDLLGQSEFGALVDGRAAVTVPLI